MMMAPPPPPMFAVPGGPVANNFFDAGATYRGVGGMNVVDTRASFEWDKNDTAGIVYATAIGMGMQATNVFPVLGCRSEPTVMPGFYNTGNRNYNLDPRVSH